MIASVALPFSAATAMEESSTMELGLRDRACVVTGASGGIGRATALAVAAEGASVLLEGRGHEALEAVARGCADAGVLALDVTDPDADARATRARLARFRPPA